jgi:hypothetical protein
MQVKQMNTPLHVTWLMAQPYHCDTERLQALLKRKQRLDHLQIIYPDTPRMLKMRISCTDAMALQTSRVQNTRRNQPITTLSYVDTV